MAEDAKGADLLRPGTPRPPGQSDRHAHTSAREPFPQRERSDHLVPVSAEPVLVRVDGDRGHGQFMGRSEDADSDLLIERKDRKG